jgi:hypothetical protein
VTRGNVGFDLHDKNVHVHVDILAFCIVVVVMTGASMKLDLLADLARITVG